MATNMTFVDFVTPVPADWLNNVNTVVNTPVPNQTVANITALKALSKLTSSSTNVEGYYTPNDGGGGVYFLNSSDVTSPDNGGTIIVASDGGRWYLQWFNSVSLLQFGAKADNGVTNNNTAFNNAQAWVASGAVRNKLTIPAGKYGYTVSPNWAIQNATIEGQGEVHFVYLGTGQALILDGVAAPNLGVYDMKMTGITIDSVSSAQDGAFISYCHHSTFERIKVRGAGSTFSGIKTSFCVASHFINCEVSPNADGGWFGGAMPLYGIRVTGPTNILQTSYCAFTNCIFETLTTTNGAGIFLESALGNNFYGGTSEGCYTGVLTASAAVGCVSNKLFGMDLEANTQQDIYEQGFQNEYHSCDTNTLVNVIGVSERCAFYGGQHQNISIATGASYTGFFGVVWNRNGSGTFLIGDNTTRIRDCLNHILNIPGPFTQTSVSPGASPWTYTNTHGRDQVLAVSVSGGTVSQAQIIRSGTGTLIASTTGLFSLSPQDQLQLTYTGTLSVWSYDK